MAKKVITRKIVKLGKRGTVPRDVIRRAFKSDFLADPAGFPSQARRREALTPRQNTSAEKELVGKQGPKAQFAIEKILKSLEKEKRNLNEAIQKLTLRASIRQPERMLRPQKPTGRRGKLLKRWTVSLAGLDGFSRVRPVRGKTRSRRASKLKLSGARRSLTRGNSSPSRAI